LSLRNLESVGEISEIFFFFPLFSTSQCNIWAECCWVIACRLPCF
jgi:hypothetical protein